MRPERAEKEVQSKRALLDLVSLDCVAEVLVLAKIAKVFGRSVDGLMSMSKPMRVSK